MTQVGSNVVLGYYPGAIALSSDGAYAYITSSWDSTLKKYRTSDMTQVSSIVTGSWPYGIALSHA